MRTCALIVFDERPLGSITATVRRRERGEEAAESRCQSSLRRRPLGLGHCSDKSFTRFFDDEDMRHGGSGWIERREEIMLVFCEMAALGHTR